MMSLKVIEQLLTNLRALAGTAPLGISYIGRGTYSVTKNGEHAHRGSYATSTSYIAGFVEGWDAAQDQRAQDEAGASL
jgi:hypothetical protein